MSRTKGRARKGVNKGAEPKNDAGPSTAPDAASLIEKAHILLGQSNFELAIKFLTRALSLGQDNLEARELLGVAEIEGGDPDQGREHLLHLFPPHTPTPPTSPSAYLYLAQTASDPQEALKYYGIATEILEKSLNDAKGQTGGDEEQEQEYREMAVTALVAMVEIWMSDLCFEQNAESNCGSLITRALAISPDDVTVRTTLASFRMSQARFDEAKEISVKLFDEIDQKEPFDPSLPPLPTRLTLVRLLLEQSLHLSALSLLSTAREEDSIEVESAYLEGWAFHLRGDSVEADSSLIIPDDEGVEGLSAQECYEESLRALIECGALFADQDYPDEGIGAHVKELIEGLEKRGIKPAVHEDEEGEEAGEWEDVDGADVEMA